MRAIGRRIEPDGAYPALDDTSILPGGQVKGGSQSAGEGRVGRRWRSLRQKLADRRPSLWSDLELHRPAGLPLNVHAPVLHLSSGRDVLDPQGDEIAAAELAVDCEIEQG
jgi:hypothetical protein